MKAESLLAQDHSDDERLAMAEILWESHRLMAPTFESARCAFVHTIVRSPCTCFSSFASSKTPRHAVRKSRSARARHQSASGHCDEPAQASCAVPRDGRTDPARARARRSRSALAFGWPSDHAISTSLRFHGCVAMPCDVRSQPSAGRVPKHDDTPDWLNRILL